MFLPSFAYAVNDLRVLVVLSENVAPYQSFTAAFQQNLPDNIQARVFDRAESFSAENQQADLIVTVGVKAAEWVMERTATPVLAVMIPSTKYADLLAKHTRNRLVSAIYIDQPLSRQVELLYSALPESKNIGVLYSLDSPINIKQLHNELARHGLNLIAKQMQNKGAMYSDLEDVLARGDVLLAIPDNTIYSSSNIRNILMSSYRQRIPLVGLSQAYVNAGALCSIFSTPEQFAAQASVIAISFAQTQHLPDPQPPKLYTIAVNQDVARSLDITIKSPELLHLQVEKAGGVP